MLLSTVENHMEHETDNAMETGIMQGVMRIRQKKGCTSLRGTHDDCNTFGVHKYYHEKWQMGP